MDVSSDKEPELHAQLVQACIDELLECLQDENTLKLWRAKCMFTSCCALHSQPSALMIVASYTSQPSQKHTPLLPSTQLQRPQTSFLTYFASTTPDSPSKHVRLKALFALQALSGYNAETVKSQIVDKGFEKVLGLEVALLDGKVSIIWHAIFLSSKLS